MSFIGGVVPCGVCGKRVYGAERADADGQTYHKACMRCAECQCIVKLGSYAALGGKFYCKPHFRQLFARSGNYHGAFEGQADPKSKWLSAMASEVEGQGKELRRVQSHVVSRPPPSSNTTSLLREAEDQFSPTQQARKSLTPDADMNYTKRRSFFERIASGSGTTAKRVFGRSHSKDNHKKQKEEEEEAREEKGKEKDDTAVKEEQEQEQREAREREERQKREAEEAAAAAEAAQKAKKEQQERERVEREEREAREKVEEKRREKIETRRREREQAEAEAAAARKLQAEQEAAASSEQERQRLADEQRERETAAAAAAADKEKKEREEEEERERRESEAKAQREREEREAAETRRRQAEEEAKARREKEEAERKARAEAAAETRRKAAAAAETKEAPPTNDQASSSFSRVRNLTMRFAEQQKTGNGGKDLSIEGLKKEGHFKSIRDRWQFGDFNIPSFKKKE